MSSGTSFHVCASRKALTDSNCLYHREILETVFYLYYLYYRNLLSVITFMEVSSPAKPIKYNLYITCVKVVPIRIICVAMVISSQIWEFEAAQFMVPVRRPRNTISSTQTMGQH